MGISVGIVGCGRFAPGLSSMESKKSSEQMVSLCSLRKPVPCGQDSISWNMTN